MSWNLFTRKSITQDDVPVVLNGLIDEYNRGASQQDGTLSGSRRSVADADYAANINDFIISYATLTAGRAVTLPKVSSLGSAIQAKLFIVKDEAGTAGTNTITVSVSGGATIDGSSTKTITTNYGVLRVYTNGTAYFTW